MTNKRNSDGGRGGDPSSRGTNLGQGLAGVRPDQRRDLAGSGADAPTKDQSGLRTSGEQGGRDASRDGDDGRR